MKSDLKLNKTIFEVIPSYLIILLPVTLISGPFLSDLSVSIVSLIFIIYIFYYKKFEIVNNFFSKVFLIFWLYILINSLIINFNLYSIKSSFFYFRFLFFTLAFCYLLEKNQNLLRYFFYSLVGCFTVLILDGYFQYFFGYNIIGLKIPGGLRVSSFFGEELILGSYLSRLFPLLFGLTIFLYSKKKKKIYYSSLIFILSEGLIFLSGERTAFFYVNLSAIFIIIFIDKYKLLRLYTLISSILLIIFIVSINDNAKVRIIDTTLQQMGFSTRDLASTNNQKYIFSEEHQSQYSTALEMFKKNPLFGVGIKQFRNLCSKKEYSVGNYPCSTHPHNIYLQLLSETGIIGFLFLFIIFVFFSIKLIKHFFSLIKKKPLFSDFEICILSAVFITLWPISPNGNFFNNWLSIMFYLPLGILTWSLTKNKNKKT